MLTFHPPSYKSVPDDAGYDALANRKVRRNSFEPYCCAHPSRLLLHLHPFFAGVPCACRLCVCVFFFVRFQLSNIAFIKTHKTASTTLASILYRYGMRHDSNIAKFDQGGTFVDLDVASKQVSSRLVGVPSVVHCCSSKYRGLP